MLLYSRAADRHRPRRRGLGPLALTHLVPAAYIALLAEGALAGDVSEVPAGGDRRDFANPALPSVRGCRRSPPRATPPGA